MMNTNYVITSSTPTSAEQDFLDARLYEHNSAQTKQNDGQLFAFFVRNEQQEIVAGLLGGRGRMRVKYDTFGFTPRCVGKAMDRAYWNLPKRKPDFVGAK